MSYAENLSKIMGVEQTEQLSQQPKNYDVMSIPDFVRQFRSAAAQANTRVWLETMYLLPSHFSELLVHTLANKKNKLDVRLYTDGIGRLQQLNDKVLSLLWGENSLHHYQHRATTTLQKKLEDVGVKSTETRAFTPINWLVFSLLRNHFKLAVVDDILWLGGLNAGKDSDFNRIDYMMRLDSKALVDFVVGIIENQSALDKDISEKIGEETVLVDRGKPGKSIIYDTLLQQLSEIKDPAAATVTILSPWVPDDKLLDSLHDLRQKGAIILIVTSYHKMSFSPIGVYALMKNFNHLMMKLKQKDIPLVFTPLEVHGKMATITSEDGESNWGMITTHNFVSQGIKMGTTEIAIASTNQDFYQNCTGFLQQVAAVSTQIDY